MSKRYRASLPLVCVLTLTCALTLTAIATAGEPDLEAALKEVLGQKNWYGIYLKGEKTGYALTEVVETKAGEEPAVQFRMRARIKITALGQKQDLRVDESRVFLRTGPLHSVSSRFWTQASDVEATAVVQGAKLLLTTRMGALRKQKELPATKESLADALAADRLTEPDAKIGDTITIRQFEPTLQKEIEAVLTLKQRKRITFNGVPTAVSVIEAKLAGLGVSTDTFVDEKGTVLEMTVEGMFNLRLEPEKQAKDIRYSSDLIRMGCVRLDPAPKRVAQIRRLRLQITGITDRKLLVDDGRQKWTAQADGSHVVDSRAPAFDGTKAATLPVDAKKFAQELAATTFVQSDDARVQKLAATIVGNERNSYAAARKIGRWVYRNLKKVGTAALSNAVETLASKSGDCTEHTVLFVALARAAGIPAREVAGVTAIERGEGLYYHAWPEVWVGEWVAMDPTLGQDMADATHIKFAVGGAEQLFRITALFGRIEARIVPDAPAKK